MKVKHQQVCTTDPACEIRLGNSSWDNGADPAIKFTWFTGNGSAARGGEFPAVALPQMVEMAIQHGYVSAKDIVEAVAKAL